LKLNASVVYIFILNNALDGLG